MYCSMPSSGIDRLKEFQVAAGTCRGPDKPGKMSAGVLKLGRGFNGR
jgi:hypothetical protein